MNLERLFKTVRQNYHKLENVEATMNFLRYHVELLQGKRNKLKLGAIVFEIKETYFHGILLLEEVDIRYVRQDNTDTDELKIENRLKAIAGKGDLKNVLAFLVVVFILFCELYTHVYYGYQKNLPTIAYRSEHLDYILKFGFENALISGDIGFFREMSRNNYGLVDLLTDFCIYFNIIF